MMMMNDDDEDEDDDDDDEGIFASTSFAKNNSEKNRTEKSVPEMRYRCSFSLAGLTFPRFVWNCWNKKCRATQKKKCFIIVIILVSPKTLVSQSPR